MSELKLGWVSVWNAAPMICSQHDCSHADGEILGVAVSKLEMGTKCFIACAGVLSVPPPLQIGQFPEEQGRATQTFCPTGMPLA